MSAIGGRNVDVISRGNITRVMFLCVLTGVRLIFLTAGFRNRVFGRINHFRASRDQKFDDRGKKSGNA